MDNMTYSGGQAEARQAAAFNTLMKKVYWWMALALALTGMIAYWVSGTTLCYTIFSSSVLYWGLFIAEIALVWILSANIHKLPFVAAALMFVAYSILNGLVMSCIFWLFDINTIGRTFLLSAGIFGAMAVFGSVTGKDLTKIGSLCGIALFGIIIATVINIFVGSSFMDLAISWIGLIIFIGLTAWDAQKIKAWMGAYGEEENEMTMKVAVLGALELYLDFINIFLFLLRIFGGGRK